MLSVRWLIWQCDPRLRWPIQANDISSREEPDLLITPFPNTTRSNISVKFLLYDRGALPPVFQISDTRRLC